jgi:hypothetical protein
MNDKISLNEDWLLLKGFLPAGWENKAKELGALTRQRGIKSAETLMRLLLIHLADGCSLRETVVRARLGKIAEISDVALLKRLKKSSDWLKWIAIEMLKTLGGPVEKPEWVKDFDIRIVDATVITEPGSTGTNWRIHYCLKLFGLECDFLEVTSPDGGESLIRFPVKEKDLLIGDRCYSSIKGIKYVLSKKGDVILRLRNKISLKNYDGSTFKLLEQFNSLEYGQIGQWKVKVQDTEKKWIHLRLCAIKKSPKAAEYSIKKAKKEMKKKQRKINPVTLELNKYFFLITTVPEEKLSREQILLLYRARWQIELAFKRMKSILGCGHLPKYDEKSAKAWLHGKLVVAFLAQSIIDCGYFFSPWGYISNSNQ